MVLVGDGAEAERPCPGGVTRPVDRIREIGSTSLAGRVLASRRLRCCRPSPAEIAKVQRTVGQSKPISTVAASQRTRVVTPSTMAEGKGGRLRPPSLGAP